MLKQFFKITAARAIGL